MAMVFCRGCAKEIHETAPICPSCGAPQGIHTNIATPRNAVTLVFVGLGWTLVLWLAFLLLTGFIYGAMNPETASHAGELGKTLSAPYLLASACLSAILTKLGKLPGAKK